MKKESLASIVSPNLSRAREHDSFMTAQSKSNVSLLDRGSAKQVSQSGCYMLAEQGHLVRNSSKSNFGTQLPHLQSYK